MKSFLRFFLCGQCNTIFFLIIFFFYFLVNICRNTFSPYSGTVCLSGLLIYIVRVVRAVVDSAMMPQVKLILRCCVNALLATFDFLNKLTINFVALTCEAYYTSARMTCELLKRNLLSVVFVEDRLHLFTCSNLHSCGE